MGKTSLLAYYCLTVMFSVLVLPLVKTYIDISSLISDSLLLCLMFSFA